MELVVEGLIMTQLEWNLQEIFINSQSFYDEIEYIKKLIKNIKQYENVELDPTLLLKILDKKWKIKELSNKVLIYGSLKYYKNINDDECIELKKVAENFNNEVNAILNFIDRKILALGFEKVFRFIALNPQLEMYKLSLHNLFRLEEHIPKNEINQKIKENSDIINEKLSIYNNLLRDIEYGNINIDGEEVKITSSNFKKYISSRDRKIRRQTYFVVNEAFQKEKNILRVY